MSVPGDLTVVVTNPPPGGGGSSPAPFAVIGASLEVDVINLPPGVPANVQVSGPNGLNVLVTSNSKIAGFGGTYSVSATGVTVGAVTYYPSVPVQSATLQIAATSTITVDYHTIVPNTTKVLDSAGNQSVTVSLTGDSITLPRASSTAQSLAPGDILVAGPSPGAPNGLLVKILSVSASGGSIMATVQQAALEDAIQQATITFSTALVPSAPLQSLAAHNRAGSLPTAIVAPGLLPNSCATNPLTFNQPFDLTIDVLHESGNVEFCPSLDFKMDISGFKLQSLQATINAGVHSDFEVDVTPTATPSFSQTFTPLVLPAVTVPVAIPPFPPIPVVLNLQLEPFVNVNGVLTASLKAGLSADATASAGFSYLNGSVSPVSNLTVNFSPIQPSLDATFTIKGQVGVNLGLLVYGVNLLSVPTDVFLKFDAATTNNPWWILSGGFEGPADIDLHIMSRSLAQFHLPDIFGFSQDLLQAPGPFTSGTVAPTIDILNPNQAQVGSTNFKIAITGSNFVRGDAVTFAGVQLPTTIVDSGDLTSVLPASSLANPGTFSVLVTDSNFPSIVSNSGSFTVVGSGINPVPVISSLSPASLTTASAPQTLTINGANFVPTSTATLNGSTRAATFIASDQLTIPLTAADLAQTGSLPVVVNNPAPGGGPSNPLSLSITGALDIISTIAGSTAVGHADGPPLQSQFCGPSGVAFDAGGNMYIADNCNHAIRELNAANGLITTIAGQPPLNGFTGDGGPAVNARLFGPSDVATDSSGNLYISDTWNSRIRKISATSGVISTIAGDGIVGFTQDGVLATSSHLNNVLGLKVDAIGDVYFADSGNNRIRRIDAVTGIVTTIAGNGTAGFTGDGGPASVAELNFPVQIAFDSGGNLYIADYQNFRVRRVDAKTGTIATVAGNGTSFFPTDGGPATNSAISGIQSLIFDPSGALFITDLGNARIRVVNVSLTPISVAGIMIQPGNIDSIAGIGTSGYKGDEGLATSAQVDGPTGLSFDPVGNLVFADHFNEVIRRITLH
jgi:sugar lactone lactonase YvrE